MEKQVESMLKCMCALQERRFNVVIEEQDNFRKF